MSRPKHGWKEYVTLADTGLGPSDIARRLGDVTEASVRRGLETARRNGWTPPRVQSPNLEIEQPYRLDLRKGPAAVTADYHFPLTRYDLVEKFLRDSEKE